MIKHGRFEVAKSLGKKDCVINVKLLRGKTINNNNTNVYIGPKSSLGRVHENCQVVLKVLYNTRIVKFDAPLA